MKRRGRVHWLTIAGSAGLVIALLLFFLAGEGPASVAGRFMGALARGNYKQLAEMSYFPDKDQKTVEEEWKYATQVGGRHYLFAYEIFGQVEATSKTASVRMKMTRNLSPSAYEENQSLPLIKADGKWKVDVRAMSRQIYPFMPQ